MREHEVPDDVAAPQFFQAMIRQVLFAAPVSFHVAVRGKVERRFIPVAESDAEVREDE